MDKITAQFSEQLLGTGISKLTLKNYKSDLNNFTRWLISYAKTTGANPENLQETLPFINSDTAKYYKDHLLKTTSEKTTNRRLSTLRKFSLFIYENSYLDFNFTDDLHNQTSVKDIKHNNHISKYSEYLQSQKISKNTLKNYLSDIRQFEAWYTKNASLGE